MKLCYGLGAAPNDNPRRDFPAIPRLWRVSVNSDISQDDDAPVAVGDAIQTLETIMADENALWTKITQPRLEEILEEHDKYLDGLLGSKRASLKFLDMSYLEFSGRNLTQADCTGARCEHATMEEAILRATNFYAADLRFVSFIGADLSRADLRGACLRGVDFTGANLTEADMRDG
jgi:hypothetical protein